MRMRATLKLFVRIPVDSPEGLRPSAQMSGHSEFPSMILRLATFAMNTRFELFLTAFIDFINDMIEVLFFQ